MGDIFTTANALHSTICEKIAKHDPFMNLSWKLEKCENHVLCAPFICEKEESWSVEQRLIKKKGYLRNVYGKNSSIVREKVIGLINAVI